MLSSAGGKHEITVLAGIVAVTSIVVDVSPFDSFP